MLSLELSGKKCKISISPPSSPVKSSSFGATQHNGYHNDGFSYSPRHMSASSDKDVFLQNVNSNNVFSITSPNRESVASGKSGTIRSNASGAQSPRSTLSNRGSSLPADKYKWNESGDFADGVANSGDKPVPKTNSRKVCVIVAVIVLICAIAAAVTVILLLVVFDVDGSDKDGPTTMSPQLLTLEGTLDLNRTWEAGLADRNSRVYQETAANFTAEMDVLMKNSLYRDAYERTEVIDFRPGSIKVDFRIISNGRYSQVAGTSTEYAALVERHINLSINMTSLPVVNGSFSLKPAVQTSSTVIPTPPSSTAATTTIVIPTTTISVSSTILPSTTVASSNTETSDSSSFTSLSSTTTSTPLISTSSSVTSSSPSITPTPSTTSSSLPLLPTATTHSTTVVTSSIPPETTSSISTTSTSELTSSSSTVISTPTTTTSSTQTMTSSTSTMTSTSISPTPTSSTTMTSSSTTLQPTTEAPDFSPTADAGKDVTIQLPVNSLTLDGSNSSDDRAIVSYKWRLVLPLTSYVGLNNDDSPVTMVTNLTSGVFVFGLTVTDAKSQSASDNVTVTVLPEPISTTTSTTHDPGLCELVAFTQCRSRGFTFTTFPNVVGFDNSTAAATSFNVVARDVINQLCQEAALTYLCSLYFPKCDPATGYQSFPCASLCNEAVSTCGAHFVNPLPCESLHETDCDGLPSTTPAPVTTPKPDICEPTQVQECEAMGFNRTSFPNHFNETNQSLAIVSLDEYIRPLVNESCHANVWFFVCSIQFPVCANNKILPPCRRFCEDVMTHCTDLALYYPYCKVYPDIDCSLPPQPIATCDEDKFSCGQVQKCVSRDQLCDGQDDCGDWSDEMDCTCSEHQFQCRMGMCIKSYQRCDNNTQCPDGSDELECNGCTRGQVACPSGMCIMSEWLCDGQAECEDGWDEINCDSCLPSQFSCADRNRTCIDLSMRCDSKSDCPDAFDEFQCISDTYGMLQLPVRKTSLPVCADTWHDAYGDYTCSLLGHGSYINKTDVVSNLAVLLNLTAEGSLPSVLGSVELTWACPDTKAVQVNCQPRGCGKRQVTTQSFIVGGEDAPPGAWPWHVGLQFFGLYFCGGSLINPEFVLTAAHCVEKYRTQAGDLTVVLGTNNRAVSEVTRRVVDVKAVESHENHVWFESNDIAILQLDRPVTYTPYIQPICLPEVDEYVPLYSTCYTVGWGWEKWQGSFREVLQQLKMKVWDLKKCNSSLAWNGNVYDTTLCAGYYSGVKSICRGDSGGPLVCQDNTGTWKLHGVASYVANNCNMTERPNIYTDMKQFLPWIQEKTTCKFVCDNKLCLYKSEYLCDRVDHCGDNSDEIRPCSLTVACDFEDKFLCGYQYKGWALGQDNKQSIKAVLGAQTNTQSSTPQYDHTLGRYPGHFFYGKLVSVTDAELLSPRFKVSLQSCIRFSFYLRNQVLVGLRVYTYEYVKGSNNSTYSRKWPISPISREGRDEWRTGYFDLSLGEYQLQFLAGDLMRTAIDDVQIMSDACSASLCKADEYRCVSPTTGLDNCVPRASKCNKVLDCYQGQDEEACQGAATNYTCTFENGNLCGLRQEVEDGTDWWLVPASFVRQDVDSSTFTDHTTGTKDGYVFYMNNYGIQSGESVLMRQRFRIGNQSHCLTFHYQMEVKAEFKVQIDCDGCSNESRTVYQSFEGAWTLFQTSLPVTDFVNVTYDVRGVDQGYLLNKFIAMDDITLRPGACPEYECPANYIKCRTSDACFPTTAECDRTVHCADEYDEENCTCTTGEFRCDNGRCLPLSQQCDRSPQCLDKSDEGSRCVSMATVSCTFEHQFLCGYQFVQYSGYTWGVNSGPTPTATTGPITDHTFQNKTGRYLYAEAGLGSRGDNASVVSPVFNTTSEQSLRVYYHLFSSDPLLKQAGELLVSVISSETGENVTSWRSDPLDLQDAWRLVCFDLPSNTSLKVVFTSLRTEVGVGDPDASVNGVDIAIDDVQLINYTCQGTTPSPVPTTTPAAKDPGTCSSTTQWTCNSGQCVDKSYRCDNHSDCRDSSDEVGCT